MFMHCDRTEWVPEVDWWYLKVMGWTMDMEERTGLEDWTNYVWREPDENLACKTEFYQRCENYVTGRC